MMIPIEEVLERFVQVVKGAAGKSRSFGDDEKVVKNVFIRTNLKTLNLALWWI